MRNFPDPPLVSPGFSDARESQVPRPAQSRAAFSPRDFQLLVGPKRRENSLSCGGRVPEVEGWHLHAKTLMFLGRGREPGVALAMLRFSGFSVGWWVFAIRVVVCLCIGLWGCVGRWFVTVGFRVWYIFEKFCIRMEACEIFVFLAVGLLIVIV